MWLSSWGLVRVKVVLCYRPCSTELAKPLWPFSITMTLLALFADPKLYPRISEKSQIPTPP